MIPTAAGGAIGLAGAVSYWEEMNVETALKDDSRDGFIRCPGTISGS